MAARSKDGPRGGLPSPALPGSGSWGSPFSLSAVRPLSLPAATPVTRRLVRSSSLDRLADNTQAARRRGRASRPKAPACTGPNVVSLRKPRRRSGDVPGALYSVPGRQPSTSGSAQSGSAAEVPATSRGYGVHASRVRPQDYSLAVAVSGLPRIDGLSRIDRFSGSHEEWLATRLVRVSGWLLLSGPTAGAL
jgi:hypothetical protein